MTDDWEREAANWIAWARTPGHDSYWYYRELFFDEIVPAPGRGTLEVGCGEGRVTRDLNARGHDVVGVDTSPTLLAAAREADPDGKYVLADAAALPFENEWFDVVVIYNALMDFDDMPGAAREAARVLAPDGCLCVSVTHPLSDAGTFESREPGARFVIEGSYFERRRFQGTFERAGLVMTFRGWIYPIEDYARALEDAGLVIARIREPPAPESAVAAYGEGARRRQRIPNFLWLRAIRG